VRSNRGSTTLTDTRGEWRDRVKHPFLAPARRFFQIPSQAIDLTVRIFREYGAIEDGHEGFVYWCGVRGARGATVRLVIAPSLASEFAGVHISAISNARAIEALSKNSMVELAQVHSHPRDWVDHSCGDDQLAPFKVDGLLSIVVPHFGADGMVPLRICGFHLFEHGGFSRCSDYWVRRHVEVRKGSAALCDLR
jgi:hypothetical protein